MLPQRSVQPSGPESPLSRATDDLIFSTMPTPCKGLLPVIRFMISTQGKRLRSRLLILSARTLAAQPARLNEAAALVELLHNGTLLHDDVMDRAAMRRHRPTANRLWGDPVAILAGDFLLASVMDLALRTEQAGVPALAVDTLMQLVSGQMQEVRNEGNLSLDEAEYMETIQKKTGSLFAASCRMGGLIARGRPEQVRALETFGMEFGLAYQILDDLRDYLSDPSDMGKEAGRDLAEAKVTLPLLFAFQQAGREKQQRIRQLFSKKNRRRHLEEIRSLIQDLGGFSHTLFRARQCVERATETLEALPEGEAKRGMAHAAAGLIGKEAE